MRTPKITAKRALGLTIAGALAVAGTVAVANVSQAASTSITLSPATGSSTASTVISVTGTGFQDTTGTVTAKAARFILGTSCGVDATAGTAASSFNVISATKVAVNSPAALTAGSYMLCIFNSTTSTSTLLGGGKFVTAAGPTATTISGSAATVATASALGGTVVSVAGTGFDKTSTASIDGVKAAATLVSPTKLSVKLPAHAAGSLFKIKVSGAYGSASTSDTVSFVPIATVTPATGNGTAGNVIQVTGSGFNGLTFSSTAGVVVAFVPGGATYTSGTAVSALNVCTDVTVTSDTALSCKAPALSGAYSVQLLNVTGGNWASANTTVSKTATYTAATF